MNARPSPTVLARRLNAGQRVQCPDLASATAVVLAAGAGGIVNVIVQHDDVCSAIACRCTPTYALERGGVARALELAEKSAVWARQSVS